MYHFWWKYAGKKLVKVRQKVKINFFETGEKIGFRGDVNLENFL